MQEQQRSQRCGRNPAYFQKLKNSQLAKQKYFNIENHLLCSKSARLDGRLPKNSTLHYEASQLVLPKWQVTTSAQPTKATILPKQLNTTSKKNSFSPRRASVDDKSPLQLACRKVSKLPVPHRHSLLTTTIHYYTYCTNAAQSDLVGKPR